MLIADEADDIDNIDNNLKSRDLWKSLRSPLGPLRHVPILPLNMLRVKP